MQVWYEIVRIEVRATREADRRYPLPYDAPRSFLLEQIERQNSLVESLIKRYSKELAARYGLTSAQLDEIVAEAMKKNWPFPQL